MHTKAANAPAIANGAKHIGPSSVDPALVNPMHTTELTTPKVQLPNLQHKKHQIKKKPRHHNEGGIDPDKTTDLAKVRLEHMHVPEAFAQCIPHILVFFL